MLSLFLSPSSPFGNPDLKLRRYARKSIILSYLVPSLLAIAFYTINRDNLIEAVTISS